MEEFAVNREHKDRLFKFIFGRAENRKWTLSLYNATSGSHYNDPEEIEINTIEDVIYMGMKNDVSYILQDTMNIYEQQSTSCPNMPVREFLYAGKLYDKYIKSRGLNIYGNRQIQLPIPKLVVFYNGREEAPDEQILELADAFAEEKRELADLTVRVRMININYGHNTEIMEACGSLRDYAWFIQEIRRNSLSMDIESSVDKAINEMDPGAELKSFLIEHRSEVKMSCLTEYDEEATMRMFARDAREEGIEEGLKEGLKAGKMSTALNLHQMGMTDSDIAKAVSESIQMVKEWLYPQTGNAI